MACLATILLIIFVVVHIQWKLYQLDANNDFLYGDIFEMVYVENASLAGLGRPPAQHMLGVGFLGALYCNLHVF